jgi:hypothetical protein
VYVECILAMRPIDRFHRYRSRTRHARVPHRRIDFPRFNSNTTVLSLL